MKHRPLKKSPPIVHCINNTFDNQVSHSTYVSSHVKMQMYFRTSISNKLHGIVVCNTPSQEAYAIRYWLSRDVELYRGTPFAASTYLPLGTSLRFALVFLYSCFLRHVNELAESSLVLKIPHLKTYTHPKICIARRQTCPNCSSLCYASGHICYDSAFVLHYCVCT